MESGERQIIGISVADTEKMFGMIKSLLLLLLNIVNILIRRLNIQGL
jgi:hypothetical protein